MLNGGHLAKTKMIVDETKVVNKTGIKNWIMRREVDESNYSLF